MPESTSSSSTDSSISNSNSNSVTNSASSGNTSGGGGGRDSGVYLVSDFNFITQVYIYACCSVVVAIFFRFSLNFSTTVSLHFPVHFQLFPPLFFTIHHYYHLFTTFYQSFFLAWRALHLGVVQQFEMFYNIHRNLQHYQDGLETGEQRSIHLWVQKVSCW